MRVIQLARLNGQPAPFDPECYLVTMLGILKKEFLLGHFCTDDNRFVEAFGTVRDDWVSKSIVRRGQPSEHAYWKLHFFYANPDVFTRWLIHAGFIPACVRRAGNTKTFFLRWDKNWHYPLSAAHPEEMDSCRQSAFIFNRTVNRFRLALPTPTD